jgi:hypothetical protein
LCLHVNWFGGKRKSGNNGTGDGEGDSSSSTEEDHSEAYGFLFFSLLFCIMSFTVVYTYAVYHTRRTWIKESTTPEFARKEGFQLTVDSQRGGTVTLKTFEPHWIKVLRSIPPKSGLVVLLRGYFYAFYLFGLYIVMDVLIGESSFIYKWLMPWLSPYNNSNNNNVDARSAYSSVKSDDVDIESRRSSGSLGGGNNEIMAMKRLSSSNSSGHGNAASAAEMEVLGDKMV